MFTDIIRILTPTKLTLLSDWSLKRLTMGYRKIKFFKKILRSYLVRDHQED